MNRKIVEYKIVQMEEIGRTVKKVGKMIKTWRQPIWWVVLYWEQYAQAMVKYEQEQDIMQSFRIQCAKDSVTLTNKEIDKRFNKFKNDFSKEIKDKYLDLDSNSI